MKSTADKLVNDYLRRLNRELAGFPRARRRELVEEISDHIAEARAGLEKQSEAEIRSLLDRIGEPEDIAAEARERSGARPRRSRWDVVALILLLIGGIVLPVIGWLVGVVLLWASEAWTAREKLIGTLVVPGGLALPLFLGLLPLVLGLGTSAELCVEGPGQAPICEGGRSTASTVLVAALMIALLLAPIVTTVYLARRMRQRRGAAA